MKTVDVEVKLLKIVNLLLFSPRSILDIREKRNIHSPSARN
jgi:hypothetical protein